MADPDLTRRLRDGAMRCEHHDEVLQADDPCKWGGVDTTFWAMDMRAAADRIDHLQQQLAALHTAIGDPLNLRWLADTFDLPLLERIRCGG